MSISSSSKLYTEEYNNVSIAKAKILVDAFKNFPDQRLSVGLHSLGLHTFHSKASSGEIKVFLNLSAGKYSISPAEEDLAEKVLLDKLLARYACFQEPSLEGKYKKGVLGDPKGSDAKNYLTQEGAKIFSQSLRAFLNDLVDIQGGRNSTYGSGTQGLMSLLHNSQEVRKLLDFALVRAESREIQDSHREKYFSGTNHSKIYYPINSLEIKLVTPNLDFPQTVLKITHCSGAEVLGTQSTVLVLESPGIFKYASATSSRSGTYWLSVAPNNLETESQLAGADILEGLPSQERDWREVEKAGELNRAGLLAYIEDTSGKFRKARRDSMQSKGLMGFNKALHSLNEVSAEFERSKGRESLQVPAETLAPEPPLPDEDAEESKGSFFRKRKK